MLIKDNNNKLVFVLLSAFIFLFLINLVSSAPPFQTNTGTIGLQVAGIDFSAIKTNTARTAVANVYNLSNGMPMLSGVACQFQVFRVGDTGALVFTNSTPKIVNETFYFGIPNNVYTVEGEYTGIITCNTTTLGGFYKSTFDATPTGLISTKEFLWIFLAIITGTFILGIGTKNNWVMTLASTLVIFFGFYIIIYGVDLIKNTTTTWVIGIICWALGVMGLFYSVEGQLAEGGWR